jgi:hypothetical protein
MIMNKPSMRNAKMPASDTVARNSGALIREEVTDGLDIKGARRNREGAVPAASPSQAVRSGAANATSVGLVHSRAL